MFYVALIIFWVVLATVFHLPMWFVGIMVGIAAVRYIRRQNRHLNDVMRKAPKE